MWLPLEPEAAIEVAREIFRGFLLILVHLVRGHAGELPIERFKEERYPTDAAFDRHEFQFRETIEQA